MSNTLITLNWIAIDAAMHFQNRTGEYRLVLVTTPIDSWAVFHGEDVLGPITQETPWIHLRWEHDATCMEVELVQQLIQYDLEAQVADYREYVPAAEPPTIPDFFSPLEAWRKFDTMADGSVLCSVGIGQFPWLSAESGAAYCASGSGEFTTHGACPSLKCSCGYYAYKKREDAEVHGQGQILARIEVWGRIAEHERGYRCEHARIKELFLLDSLGYLGEQVKSLEKRYKIPVTILKGKDAWISESPSASSWLNPWLAPSSYQIGSTITVKLPRSVSRISPPPSPPQSVAQLKAATNAALATANARQAAHLQALQRQNTYWNQMMLGLGNMLPRAPMLKTEPPKRQYFDFTGS